METRVRVSTPPLNVPPVIPEIDLNTINEGWSVTFLLSQKTSERDCTADARKLMSYEHRALGYRPPPGSLAAEAQAVAAKLSSSKGVGAGRATLKDEILREAAKRDAERIKYGRGHLFLNYFLIFHVTGRGGNWRLHRIRRSMTTLLHLLAVISQKRTEKARKKPRLHPSIVEYSPPGPHHHPQVERERRTP